MSEVISCKTNPTNSIEVSRFMDVVCLDININEEYDSILLTQSDAVRLLSELGKHLGRRIDE